MGTFRYPAYPRLTLCWEIFHKAMYFGTLKTIATFLDAHLAVDDNGEGTSAEVKKRRREQTGE